MKSWFCIAVILIGSFAAFGQSNPDKSPDKQKFPQFKGLKPRIELPKALRIMEKFVKKEKINISNYYLSRVNIIQYGAKNDKQPLWYFRWVNVDGSVGDYIEIAVFMDGSVRRLPPM